MKEYPDFDTAVDEYFSKIYAQKVEIEKVEHERTVDTKLAKVPPSPKSYSKTK